MEMPHELSKAIAVMCHNAMLLEGRRLAAIDYLNHLIYNGGYFGRAEAEAALAILGCEQNETEEKINQGEKRSETE